MEDVVTELLLAKEPMIARANEPYKARRNFFELMRFDFMLDKNVRIGLYLVCYQLHLRLVEATFARSQHVAILEQLRRRIAKAALVCHNWNFSIGWIDRQQGTAK